MTNYIHTFAAGDTFDPTTAFAGLQTNLVDAVNTGAPILGVVGGALLALGIVWRLIKRGAKA